GCDEPPARLARHYRAAAEVGAHDAPAEAPADVRALPVAIEEVVLEERPLRLGLDEDEIGIGAGLETALSAQMESLGGSRGDELDRQALGQDERQQGLARDAAPDREGIVPLLQRVRGR